MEGSFRSKPLVSIGRWDMTEKLIYDNLQVLDIYINIENLKSTDWESIIKDKSTHPESDLRDLNEIIEIFLDLHKKKL